ncbi:hypothetical protein [Streptomyces phaeochromogenes]|uniref:hypothetical protein n=1 Tax=Streptomyces phaeochromogenes TaxID=1923 RepID=UPI0038690CE8|nr:hypothetical protein OG478_52470 [Streptomyces phaeochromogenes]
MIILVGAGVWVVRRRRQSYPGEWAFTFGLKYEGDRDALAKARSKARDWDRRAAQEESWAEREVTSAEAKREQELRALEQRIAVLRNPGSGTRVDGLGELILFRHRLVVKSISGTGTRSIELADLDAQFDRGEKNYYIYCTDATGRIYRADYPHSPAAIEAQEERFDENRVRDFAMAIKNAAVVENGFRAQLPRQIQEAEAELEKVRADASELDAARERLERLRKLNQHDPNRKAAVADLEKALKNWQQLTGCLPPR